MAFQYSGTPHARRHGPEGYIQYETYKDWLRDEFTFRCVYCLERERWYPSGDASFGVDHVLTKGIPAYAHLICVYGNLVYACNRCNSIKQDEILLDPCATAFADHLTVAADGTITAITREGQDLIDILALDLSDRTEERRNRLRLQAMYQRDPTNEDVRALYFAAFGYPRDLPDLAKLKPKNNSRPEGIAQSYYRRSVERTLPETY